MIGLPEILVLAAVVGLIYVSRRRAGQPVESPRERKVVQNDRTTITVPRHLVTLLVTVALAVGASVGTLYLALPSWLGAVAAGIVAGIAATAFATQGFR
jgi:uncharacterized membrane protein (DUF485 family)